MDHYLTTCIANDLQTIRNNTVYELNKYVADMRGVRTNTEIQLAKAMHRRLSPRNLKSSMQLRRVAR